MRRALRDHLHVGLAGADVLRGEVVPAERLDGVAEVLQDGLTALGRERGSSGGSMITPLPPPEREPGHGGLEGHRPREPQDVAHRGASVAVGPHPAAAERGPAGGRVHRDHREQPRAAPAADEKRFVCERLGVVDRREPRARPVDRRARPGLRRAVRLRRRGGAVAVAGGGGRRGAAVGGGPAVLGPVAGAGVRWPCWPRERGGARGWRSARDGGVASGALTPPVSDLRVGVAAGVSSSSGARAAAGTARFGPRLVARPRPRRLRLVVGAGGGRPGRCERLDLRTPERARPARAVATWRPAACSLAFAAGAGAGAGAWRCIWWLTSTAPPVASAAVQTTAATLQRSPSRRRRRLPPRRRRRGRRRRGAAETAWPASASGPAPSGVSAANERRMPRSAARYSGQPSHERMCLRARPEAFTPRS